MTADSVVENAAGNTQYRIEHDTMGEVRVPINALWRAQTQRAVENFPISGRGLERTQIRALGLLKGACAQVNKDLGLLAAEKADAIIAAAAEIADGKHDDQFPIDVFQTGSGTSSNMNALFDRLENGRKDKSSRIVIVAEGEVPGASAHAFVHPVLERDLQCLLDRSRAVGREQEVRLVDRHDRREVLRELDDHAVAVAEHRRMGDAVDLLAQRRVELGVVVAEGRDPDRGDRVEVAAAVDVDDLVALRVIDDDGRVVRVRRHLREAVPDHRRVTRHPLVVLTHAADATWPENPGGGR